MNPSIISSIFITLLGIFTGLSGSAWFWAVIILLPIFVGWRIDLMSFAGIFYGGFILFMALVGSGGAIAFGDVIVFIYILLLFLVMGRIMGFKSSNSDDISPYLLFSTFIAIIGTIAISIMMP